jgi:hypothetical protein
MRIRIECGLDSRSRAGFWKNDRAGVLTFFLFKKVAKTRCGLDSRIYGICSLLPPRKITEYSYLVATVQKFVYAMQDVRYSQRSL